MKKEIKKDCKQCKTPKTEKEFRKGSRVCRECVNENDKAKRNERWAFLGLDMSSKF